MQRVWERLLGIEAPNWVQGGGWALEWLGLPQGDRGALLVLGLLAVLVVLWLAYRFDARHASRGARLLLWALRGAALAVVVAMLLEPVIVLSREEFIPSHLMVLVDGSGSMDLQDAWRDPAAAAATAQRLNIEGGAEGLRKQTRTQLVQRVFDDSLRNALSANGDREVHLHRFSDRLHGAVTDLSAATAERRGESTALGAALRQAMTTYSGAPLAGVLIVSDGQSNAGEPPAAAAESVSEARAPIVCVAVGTADGPRNAAISQVEVSPVVFARDAGTLTVHVQSRGMQDAPAVLVVEKRIDGGAWQELARENFVLQIEGAVQSFPFEIREPRPGKVEYRAMLEDLGPEMTVEDNTAFASTQVVRQRLHCLLIAGSTFPEIQFLRNTLMRDRQIELSSWLMAADRDYEHPGDIAIQRLPATQEELDGYDCVILYDPDPAGFPPNFSELLEHFVSQSGGGLVYIAGEMQTSRLFDQQTDPGLGWMTLLPVVREPGLFRSAVQMQLSARQPWRLQMTEEGRRDPVFAFAEDADANQQVLDSLPGMFWHFPITKAKPGAAVLAVHGDPRMRNEHGPEVLLATQRVGPGRTMFIAFDSTYRWRYLDEQFFDGFWARVVDRAGRDKRLGGSYPFRLSTPRASYKPGASIKVIARFHNLDDLDPGLTSLPGVVEYGDDEPQPVSLTADGDAGVFSATFPTTRSGTYLVKVWMGEEGEGENVRAATLPVPVELPDLEYDHPVVDRAALEALAACTGGRAFDLTEIHQAAQEFKIGRVRRVLEDRQEVWDAPLLWGGLFLLLVAEWILRKRVRLI